MMALQSEISQAQRQADEARRRIARQRDIIRDLRDRGHATKAAQRLLKAMLETLRTFEDRQQTLEDERFRRS